ncbi:MAG: single-stranded DNA-binding protein [Francisellaceae bacterium]
MAKGTVNKVILLGRLGVDPEVRYMPSGTTVANIRMATNDAYKDRQSGQLIENTEWHRVVVFGKSAEVVAQYCRKGSMLYIEGRIRTNKWQDQNGQDRYTTEIVATEVQLMGSRNDNNASGDFSQQQTPAGSQPFSRPQHPGGPKQTQPQKPDLSQLNDFDDDDIPF